ncbi:MAG: CotH kinase family protein [Lachnospiraceae bacterium]|nr:CotH kinase family protein [Lachnospiraceae bacterium]
MNRKTLIGMIIVLVAAGMATFIGLLILSKHRGSTKENNYAGEETVTEDSYKSVDFGKLYDDGKLDGLENVTVEKGENGGLMISGKASDINNIKLTIAGVFEFDDNPVARISLDAISGHGDKVEAFVYLDGEKKAAAEYKIRECLKEDELPEDIEFFTEPDEGLGWDTKGDVTRLVLDKNLKGRHKASLAFKVDSKDDNDETTILLRSIEFAESSIPVLYFELDENKGSIRDMNISVDKSAECSGSLNLLIPEGYDCEYLDGKVESADSLDVKYIRGRGNSTWIGSPKKPYKFKLEEAYDFFGMGKNKSWALIANSFDDSMVRNRITYWLGSQLGLSYTPQCVTVELVLNDRYYGTYSLSETVGIGEGRVEIDELSDEDEKEPDITGGYIISAGSIADEEEKAKFYTQNGMLFINDEPNAIDEGTGEQIDYIRDYVQQTEDVICSDDFKDKNGKSYTEYIDIDSMINYWWVQCFSSNPDAFVTSSTFFYKERGGKLYFGPLWDFDYAWGNRTYNGPSERPVDRFEQVDSSMEIQYLWYHKLMNDPEYVEAMKESWKEVDAKLEELTKDGGIIDQYYDEIKTSAYYNYERWNYSLLDAISREEGNNSLLDFELEDNYDFKAEIEYLKDWINRRREWINENFDDFDNIVSRATFMVDDEELIYFDVVNGGVMLDLPEAPEKEGQVFIGWFTEDGEEFDGETNVRNDITLYAKYIDKDKAIKAEKIFFDDYAPVRSSIIDEFVPQIIAYPSDAQDKTIKWTSSDESLAVVDEKGIVSIKKEGTVEITATLENGYSTSYSLIIKDLDNEEMTDYSNAEYMLETSEINISVGEMAQIKVISDPPEAMKSCTYEAEDESIVKMEDYGILIGQKPGTTFVKVTEGVSGKELICKVTVSE